MSELVGNPGDRFSGDFTLMIFFYVNINNCLKIVNSNAVQVTLITQTELFIQI